jgi:hypothetical protein
MIVSKLELLVHPSIFWQGRCMYDYDVQAMQFFYTASGCDISFTGTSLKATVLSRPYDDRLRQAHLLVFVDGQLVEDAATLFVLDHYENSILLVSGLQPGVHQVRIFKRSEAFDSSTWIKELQTDGNFITHYTPIKPMIQFIGASVSTGYGNMGSTGEVKSTTNSNGFRAFSTQTALLLDEDVEIIGASGWGISQGYNTLVGVSSTQTIPNAYDYGGIDDTFCIKESLGLYSHPRHPEVIILNLGSNDFYSSDYVNQSSSTQELITKRFIDHYTKFVIHLREVHPRATIFITTGLMSEPTFITNPLEQIIIQLHQKEIVVYPFVFKSAHELGHNVAVDGHPNVDTHYQAAFDLSLHINKMFKK